MKKTKNVVALFATVIIWGAAFVAQRIGGDEVGAYTFNCIRNIIGTLVLIPVIIILKRKPPKDKEEWKALIKGGVICGIALCIASNLQQVGINMGSSVGKAGFLTACYIVLVPILGIFLKKKCHWNVWLGVLLTFVGLFLLCMTKDDLSISLSDILLLLCALMFSVQILAIDYFAPNLDSVWLSATQFLVCGILTMIPTFIVDMKHSVAGISAWAGTLNSRAAWLAILYTGVFSSGVAYTLQIVGQKNFNPTIASLIMSLEAVFSTIFGWLLLHEVLSSRELIGCAVMLAAVIFAQLPFENMKKKEKANS